MVDALRSNKELLTKFGGHYFAAGCTFPTENLEALRAGLARYHQELPTVQAAAPVTGSDIEIRDLSGLTMQLLDVLELLEPCGSGNPQPMFLISGTRVRSMARVGAKRDHLKLTLEDQNGVRIGGIGFRLGDLQDQLGEGQLVRVIAEVNKNEWRGVQSVQLIVRDIQRD
jgi:single-stranded-DNA-specific exonuclease